MLLLGLLIVCISLPLAFAQDLVFNCAQFWPSVTPGEKYIVDAQCRLYPGYPQTIGQTTVTVIYTDDWKAELGIIDALLNEAIVQSVALYGTLTPLPDIVIVLGATHDPVAALDALIPTFPDGPCQIRSFEGWGTGEALDMNPQAMQAVAHEIYHCVQAKILGGVPVGSPGLWVIESSADYFSNLVFPRTNREWEFSIYYKPEIPIYEQTYEPSMFFQAIEPSRGMVYIHQFVMSTTYTSSGDQERARLSSIPGFVDDFWQFARDYSFNRIRDTGGGIVPVQNRPEQRGMIWSVNQDESEGKAFLEFMPFTITQFTTEFDPGQTVRVWSSAKGNQRLAWRLQSQLYWTDLQGGGSEAIVTIPCGDAPQVVRFLVISTENKAGDKIEVNYAQTYKDESCCRSGKKRDANECPTSSASASASAEPTSSAPEPTGTGTGSCAGSNIAMDPCLTGHKWSLDIPTTRELIRKNLVIVPDVIINNVQVGGSGALSVSSTEISFTYSNLKIDVDVTAADIPLPVSVIIDGMASGAFVITSGGSGSGKACLAYKVGKGTATATIPFLGQEVFDLAPGGGYLIDMDVEYTCNDGRMTIGSTAAQAPGAPGWGPFAYNAV